MRTKEFKHLLLRLRRWRDPSLIVCTHFDLKEVYPLDGHHSKVFRGCPYTNLSVCPFVTTPRDDNAAVGRFDPRSSGYLPPLREPIRGSTRLLPHQLASLVGALTCLTLFLLCNCPAQEVEKKQNPQCYE